jgi:hypothetical protein
MLATPTLATPMLAAPTFAPSPRLTRATGRRPELGPDGALVMRCT